MQTKNDAANVAKSKRDTEHKPVQYIALILAFGCIRMPKKHPASRNIQSLLWHKAKEEVLHTTKTMIFDEDACAAKGIEYHQQHVEYPVK